MKHAPPDAPAHDPYAAFRIPNFWRYMLGSLLVQLGMGGPALGALIISFSVPAAYVVNAVFAMIFTGLLFLLRLRPSPAAAGRATLATVFSGVRFVWGRKVLLAAISLDMFAVLLGGATYLLPVYASDLLQHSVPGWMPPEQILGWLRLAPAVGAFGMAILLAHLPPLRKAGRAMLLAVAGFGVATIVFGLSRNFWLSWGMLCLTGALDNISVVVRHTLVQILTPDDQRGRVSAVHSIFIGSSNEIGGFESGTVAQLFGPTVSVVSGGIGTLLVVSLWTLAFPALRRFGALRGEEPKEMVKIA